MFRNALSNTIRCLAKLPQESKHQLIPTRKCFTMDPDAYNQKYAPFASVQHFFQDTLVELGFKTDDEETVLDVGCGTGLLTTQMIVPMFPNLKRVFAMDMLPNMIEYAKNNYAHPKIEYNVANIEEWKSVALWDGCISKLLAIHTFQWVKNQREAFLNVHQLLKSGGEAAFFMELQSMFYEAMIKLKDDPKWNRYLQAANDFVAVAHTERYHASYYRQMLEEMGFIVVHAEEKIRIDALSNDQVFRNFFASICVLVHYVPSYRKEEFKDDLFRYLIREGGRTSEGMPMHVGNMLELVIRKK